MASVPQRAAAAAQRTEDAESSDALTDFYGLVGRSAPMLRLYEQIKRLARAAVPVLLQGETGTGKELAARALWRIGMPERPFVVLDCAAITPSLVESELFGHEQGAFTGASRQRGGIVAQADGGVLFIDEIAELPFHAQAKLLRVLERGEYRPVGADRISRSEFRVLAATHSDLDRLAHLGKFRRDLLHRLGAARVRLPSLRDHLEDLELLTLHFLRVLRAAGVKGPRALARSTLDVLGRAQWPGNVRQLRNVVEAGAAMADGPEVLASDVDTLLPTPPPEPSTGHTVDHHLPPLQEILDRATERAVHGALQRTGGDRDAAAELLGISRATLYRKLSRIGADKPDAESQV